MQLFSVVHNRNDKEQHKNNWSLQEKNGMYATCFKINFFVTFSTMKFFPIHPERFQSCMSIGLIACAKLLKKSSFAPRFSSGWKTLPTSLSRMTDELRRLKIVISLYCSMLSMALMTSDDGERPCSMLSRMDDLTLPTSRFIWMCSKITKLR